MKLLSVTETPSSGKQKLTATFDVDGKTRKVSFGVKGSNSYIDGATDSVRDAYLKRHAKDIINKDPMTRGNLSYYITWGSSRNLRENIKAYRERFGLV